MNARETGKLLGVMALYDYRDIGNPVEVAAWLKAIGDLPYADAEAAVVAYYGESTERIMPGHVRTRVKAMRAARLAKTPLPPPPAELADEPGRYREIIRANVERIADGMQLRKALGGGKPLDGDPPAEWQKAREAIRPGELPGKTPQDIAAEQVAEARRKRENGEVA